MCNLLESYREKLEKINTVEEFDIFINSFLQVLRREKCDEQIVQNIRNKGKYMRNSFSDEAVKESMVKAKDNLLFYLAELLGEKKTPKCTRKSMQYKKLVEEMEADIVHYEATFIYFYVYDKEKIIKDKLAFETYFNRKFDGKEVKVFVLQPVNL